MSLSQAALAIDGILQGDDAVFASVSKDTRSLEKNNLYVALKGENFDGHHFLKQAEDLGAAGALVSEPQAISLPQICVADTRIALGNLASTWRDQFKGKLVAITGSNGKTTVKEMCRAILYKAAGEENILSTQGNLNNDIGMPMTLLSLRQQHDYAVIEMGANHMGEIDYLTHIAKPDVAVITNVGSAHLEGFGSLEKIAQAKAEIYSGLSDDGVAIINLDDDYANYWREVCQDKKIKTFSMKDKNANVYAQSVGDGVYVFKTAYGDFNISIKVPGVHNVMNALAASTVALVLDVSLQDIAAGLQSFSSVAGRLNVQQGLHGARVIDDSYNANPSSLYAAIDVLSEMNDEAYLVLGDMAELGESSALLHFKAGEYARQQGVKKLYAIGELSRNAVEGFGDGAKFFEDKESLIKAIVNDVKQSMIVLVKGSRSMAMENVVSALLLDDNKNKKELN